MAANFKVNYHASICLADSIYVDPLNIQGEPHNAAAVFITHGHYDHYSPADIKKVTNTGTVFVAPKDIAVKLREDGFVNITAVEQSGAYRITDRIKAETFPAYNTDKQYHTKDKGWVGYIIETDGTRYAVCGDTDATPEVKSLRCDILFIPIGGTYTMTAAEAAVCANIIKPKTAVPVHYLGIVGSRADEETFIKNLNADISYKTFF